MTGTTECIGHDKSWTICKRYLRLALVIWFLSGWVLPIWEIYSIPEFFLSQTCKSNQGFHAQFPAWEGIIPYYFQCYDLDKGVLLK